jgi:hypothetical protein
VDIITSAFAGLKTAFDFAKAAIAARDDALVSQAVQAMNEHIIGVQNVCLELHEKIQALTGEKAALKERARQIENQLRQIEEMRADLENYERYQTARGSVCYRDKTTVGPDKKPIYICADCAERGVKTYLKPEQQGLWLVCHKHGKILSDALDESAGFVAIQV